MAASATAAPTLRPTRARRIARRPWRARQRASPAALPNIFASSDPSSIVPRSLAKDLCPAPRLALAGALSCAVIAARPRQHREDSPEREAHLMARDDRVEHAVREQKFRPLKILGQLHVAGLRRDPPSREADQRARLRNIQIAEHRKRRGHTA